MSNHKHLVYAILQFLNQQKESGTLKEDAVESLEVAAQCLETAYEVSPQDEAASTQYPLPATLPEIFSQGLDHFGQKVSEGPAPVAAATLSASVSAEDKERAEKHKGEGNEFMKQEKFQEALDCYSQAINIDSTNAVYYCNRAAAHSKLNNNSAAIDDCDMALTIDPNYSKAYGRKGLAHSAQNQHSQAIECYKRALELDPDNPSYKQNLDIAEKKATDRGPGGMPGMPGMPGMGGPGGLNLGGLDFTSMMSNPALMNMATSMMQNPQMQQLMANLMSGSAAGAPEGQSGMANLLQAGQQLAQQMQQSNPDLVEQLRDQMGGDQNPNPSNENQ